MSVSGLSHPVSHFPGCQYDFSPSFLPFAVLSGTGITKIIPFAPPHTWALPPCFHLICAQILVRCFPGAQERGQNLHATGHRNALLGDHVTERGVWSQRGVELRSGGREKGDCPMPRGGTCKQWESGHIPEPTDSRWKRRLRGGGWRGAHTHLGQEEWQRREASPWRQG